MDGEFEVKQLRESLGLTQQQLADKIGVSFQTVNRWENDRNKPSGMAIRALEALAEAKKL